MNAHETIEMLRKANAFRYNTFGNVDSDDLLSARTIVESKELIFASISGNSRTRLLWACNAPSEIRCVIRRKLSEANSGAFVMEFVPAGLVTIFEEIGFEIECEYVDHWLANLDALPSYATPSHICLREALTDDYPIIGEISGECARCSRGFTIEDDHSLREWYRAPESQIIVALIDRKIVGYCLTAIYGRGSGKGTVVWLRELAVRPSHQRNGCGTALIHHVLEWGARNGAKRSFLACDVKNEPALDLYNRFGYLPNSGPGQIDMVATSRSKSGEQCGAQHQDRPEVVYE